MHKINLDLEQFKYSGELEIDPVTESSNDVVHSHPINVEQIPINYEQMSQIVNHEIELNELEDELQIEPGHESSNDVMDRHPINYVEVLEVPNEPLQTAQIDNEIEFNDFEDDIPIPTKKERKDPLSRRGAPKIGPHICECCGKILNFNSDLKIHQQQKSGKRDFVCPIDGCNKAYAVKKRLTEHMKRFNHIID